MRKGIFSFLIVSLMVSYLGAHLAEGSMILKVDFDQVVNGSELIFEGRVVSKETRPSRINGRPFTYFIFEIIDVVKGSYTNPTIELLFR